VVEADESALGAFLSSLRKTDAVVVGNARDARGAAK
jgi:hypothetical protein